MTQHTQGPWTVEGPFFDITATRDGHPVIVATSSAGSFLPKKEAEANACLIAAAPDLLSALQHVRAEINALAGRWTRGLDEAAQEADVAIARAGKIMVPS